MDTATWVIVIGTSAGGVEALQTIASSLPENLTAAVCMVIHTSSGTLLPSILNRRGTLTARPCDTEMVLRNGNIYVPAPEQHMIVDKGRVLPSRGPLENRHRPSIDVLFRSAAIAYGPRTIGVVLTGMLNDGTAGLRAIKLCGGTTVVEDPQTACFPDMPRSALENVDVDYVRPLADIPALLVELASRPPTSVPAANPSPKLLVDEVRIASMNKAGYEHGESFGSNSIYACPVCGGVLQEREDGPLLRFRCHVGHAFSDESLLAEYPGIVEHAMALAIRTLHERLRLATSMKDKAQQRGLSALLGRYDATIDETSRTLSILESVVQKAKPTIPDGNNKTL